MKNKLSLKIFSRLITFFLIVNLILSNFLAYPVFAQEVSSDPSSATQSEETQQAPVPAEGNSTPATPAAPDVSSPDVSLSPSLAPDSASESTLASDTQENIQESTNTETETSPSPSPTSAPVPAEEKTAETETVSEETVLTQGPTGAPEPTAAPEINETPVDLSPSPIALPSANSLWSVLDEGSWITTENVELNKEYVASQNDKVKITFTKLPEASGKLTIKEVKLTNEQIEQTKALSDTAYDITSTMENGTFEYNLTLPIPLDAKDKDIEIKSAENLDQLNNAQKVEEPKEKSEDIVTVKGLNHFTVFVVTNAASATTSALIPEGKIFYFRNQSATLPQSHILSTIVPNTSNSQVTSITSTDFESFRHFRPGTVNFQHVFTSEPAHTPLVDSASWISDEALNGSFQAGGWRFVVHKSDNIGGEFSKPHFNVYSSPSNTDLSNAVFLFHAVGPDWWNNNDEQITFTSPQIGAMQFENDFLVVQLLDHCIADCNGGKTMMVFEDGLTAASQTRIETPLFAPVAAPDTTSPVITLLGENPVNLTVGDVYTDAGATALDDVDGDITANIVTTNPVNTDVIGAYAVTYNVSDAANNAAAPVTRTVNIIAAEVPVLTTITVSPAESTITEVQTFTAAALDQFGNPIATTVTWSSSDTAVGTINSSTGVFTPLKGGVTTITATSGEITGSTTATVGLTVDATAPVITMLGINPVNVVAGMPYTDAGATALDNVDGNLTTSIVTTGLPIFTIVPGTFTVTYTVTDAAGNATTTKRTVNVTDVLPAGIVEVGPIAPAGGLIAGFPIWYKDSNGLALDLMEAADGFGISDPVDPENPFSEQIGFNAEGFWWSAEASVDRPIGTRALLVLAIEAAFAGEAAVDGEQSVQNRVRYRIDGLVPGENYVITHPFGEAEEIADEDGVINVTDDTGCFAGGGVTCNQPTAPNFSNVLSGQVGPYLTWDTFGQAVTDPLLINPLNPGRRYIGNPAIEHKVTGSPNGNNVFRVEGPNVGGPGVNSIETDLFAVSGRLAEVPPPSTEEDVAAPVITILGQNPVNLTVGDVYLDAGVTALDETDGDITANVVTTGLPINTSSVGTFTVTYNVADATGNNATEVTRTVNVIAAPVPTPQPPSIPTSRAVSVLLDADNSFPLWYQDDKGVRVASCLDGADPICVLPGEGEEPNFDPTKETDFPNNFPSEFFYYIAESDPLSTPNGGKVFMRFAVEGAFLNEDPQEQDQMVFGRIRATGTGLEPNSTYTFTHPYGVDTFSTDATGTLRRNTSTEDIGCEVSPCNFQLALDSRVFGGFLSFTEGAPQGYLGDAVTPHEVKGSPTGNNFVRVEGPGLGSGLETELFTVSGKLTVVAPPPPSTEEDVTAPVITVLGANPASVTVGAIYADAGATALDNIDGDITANIVTTGLPVDTSAAGQFIITYNVSDAAGNAATPVTRTVNVIDSPLANASITIIENAIPNDPQDFGFRLRNDVIDERFSLDDDADISNDLSNTKVFLNLAPGDYSLEQNSASNWVLAISCEDQDNGTTVDVNAGKAGIDLDSGENITCTFVNSLKRSITGSVFNDLNINGAKDAGEIGLSGWMIFLDANDNGVLDSGEVSALTDANGNYQFPDLAGGTHNVVEVLQADWQQTAPVGGKHTVVVSSNNSLINQDFGNIRFFAVGSFGRFVSASGNNLTTSVISRGISTINILANGGTSSVIIPDGTVISRVDGGSFDLNELLASVPSSSILAGLEANVIDGVLQWGIPNVELQFSSPITLSIFVGNSLNGQTLDVRRSVTGTLNWTTDGIVAPATCLVASALCTFQATKASFYVAMHSVPVPTPAASSTSSNTTAATSSTGGSNSNNAVSAPVCNDAKPGSAPVLLSVIASGLGQATLTWSKALDPVTYYLIGYGTIPGQFEFGTPNIGGKDTASYTVSGLSGDTNYYFRVRAGNGCMPGEFSNEMAIRPLDTIFATNNIVSGVEENNLGTSDQDQDKTEVLGTTQQKKQTQAGITNTNFITSNPVIAAIIVLIISFLTLSAGSFYKKLRRS